MIDRRTLVWASAGGALAVFGIGAFLYARRTDTIAATVSTESTTLVRPHSPILGPAKAPVTMVEFFDPSCESCRAMYPHVKQVMSQFPNDVRLVIRYAPFHQGSDEAVKLLEAARLQNRFLPVLEALLDAQPRWAIHGAPNLAIAWEAAKSAGLDVERARKDAARPEFEELLRQDLADLRSMQVKATPTFFVNGKRLASLGPLQLMALVESEAKAQKKAK